MKKNTFKDLVSLFHKIYILFPLNKSFLILILISMILLTLIELLGIGLVVPLVGSLLNNGSNYEFNDKFSQLIGIYDKQINFQYLVISLIIIFTLKALITVFLEFIILRLSLVSRAKLRGIMTNLYFNADYAKFMNSNSSNLLNAIQNFVGEHRAGVLNSLKLLNDLIFLFFTFSFLYYLYGSLALISLIFSIFIIYIFDRITKNYIQELGKKVNLINGKIIKLISESLYGFKEIKMYSLGSFFSKALKDISLEHSKIDTNFELISKLPRIIIELIIVIFFLLFGLFIYSNEISFINILPDLSLFIVVILRFIPLSTSISSCVGTLRHARNSIDLLYADFNLFQNDISNNLKKSSNEFIPFESFALNHVSFKYPKSSKFIFNNINFDIKSGEFIGIIGKSGSGKTTFVDILLGLLKPNHGDIIINGDKNYVKNNDQNSFFSYIPQDNFILEDTLEKNIAIDFYLNKINRDKIKLSLKKVGLYKHFQNLPSKLNTNLGEHGKFLSGGQKQRIALARSFYFNKQILILDESTNALDEDSEKEVLREIFKLKGRTTLIMITHNLDNLKNCDKIYEIKNSKIKLIKNNTL